MYTIRDAEGRFVGHPHSAVTAHRWSRRSNMAGGRVSAGRKRISTQIREHVLRVAAVDLMTGKRLEVQGPGNRVIYMGETTHPPVGVRGPVAYWYEHPGGRTYKETPEAVLTAVLPHVGIDAIEVAIRHDANRVNHAGESLDVANTILAQLGGGGRLRAMIGARDFSGGTNVLTFRWAARARNGANNIRITLEPSDTYKVEFHSVRGRTVKLKGSFDDIYAEDLVPLFERETWLYLRM